jgi:class 3 adenylate cyclase/tetratricopeptide (TPR) repeat protein
MSDSPETAQFVADFLQAVDHGGWERAAADQQAALAGNEPTIVELRDLTQGWLALGKVHRAEAARQFAKVESHLSFGGLACLGEAALAIQIKDFVAAERALDQATARWSDQARIRGGVAHLRGTIAAHLGDSAKARRCLFEALRELGPKHFAYGRVLDTLGNLFANASNFLIARFLYQAALKTKAQVGDRRGLALTNGQLGRLCQDYGRFDEALKYFQNDLELAQDEGDLFGQARMYGALGQIVYLQAQRERRADATAQIDSKLAESIQLLRMSIRVSQEHSFRVNEGFARKDLAIAHLEQGDLVTAENELSQARQIFADVHFAEGLHHVERVHGLICIAQAQWSAARQHLDAALQGFMASSERTEVAQTKLELARLAVREGASNAEVERAFRAALHEAELTHRPALVGSVEAEFQTAAPLAFWTDMFQRVRGRRIQENFTSLVEGRRETVTVLYLDLQGSTDFARDRDPEEVMMTINQMMAETSAVLRRHGLSTLAFRGDGFLAVARDANHAARAVEAGLDLVAQMHEFNEPRQVLGMPSIECRIGISSGEVLLGNVGTYDKMDYSAIGATMNLGARVEANARVGLPSISAATRALVGEQFVYAPHSPRKIDAKGVGMVEVWDVVSRAT